MAEPALVLAARPIPAEAGPREARTARRRSKFLAPLGLYAASRLVVLVASIPAALGGDPGKGPWPEIEGGSALDRVFAQWDGAWYLWVADRGYPTRAEYRHHLSDVAFFPAFPALIRGVSSLTGLSTLHAAILVSFVLGAAATVLVWQLAVRLVGRSKANRAVRSSSSFQAPSCSRWRTPKPS